MRKTATGLVAGLIIAAGLLPATANEFEDALRALADDRLQALASDPAIISAIEAQNKKHAGLDEAKILEMDQKWRAEVGTASTPTIDPVLSGPVADRLRAFMADGEGLFTEIFVMDNVGLNVAASDTTSDYWQGDEAKWQETYTIGAGAIHVSEVELDESTQTYQAQVSIAITDAAGQPIGAATFGVNVDYLE